MSCQIGIWFSKKIELLPVRQFNEPNDDFLMEQITQRKKGLHLPNWMLNIKPCWTKWNLVVQWVRYLELNWVDASKTRGPGFETWHPHFECRTGCFTSSFSKMGRPRPLFYLFWSFSNKHYIFYNKHTYVSIQKRVLWFELTTISTWDSSHNQQIRAPGF